MTIFLAYLLFAMVGAMLPVVATGVRRAGAAGAHGVGSVG
jgi:hypothetical protein